ADRFEFTVDLRAEHGCRPLFVLTVRQPVVGWWGYPQGCELKHPGALCSAAGEFAKLVTTSAGDCDFPPSLSWQSIRLLIEGSLVRAQPGAQTKAPSSQGRVL